MIQLNNFIKFNFYKIIKFIEKYSFFNNLFILNFKYSHSDENLVYL